MPSATSPGSSEETATLSTSILIPSTNRCRLGTCSLCLLNAQKELHSLPAFLFALPVSFSPAGPSIALYYLSQRLCLAFLSGIFGSISAWWGAEGLKHKVSEHW